jgi:uncharacterized protein (DUF1697 family)
MTIHVAFLRSINVGGHNRMNMDELRTLCESLEYRNVRTHLQSGNVVFQSDTSDPDTLATELTAAISDEFSYDVPVLVRTREELETVETDNPFEGAPDEARNLHVTFLSSEPTAGGLKALEAAQTDAEQLIASGREVYSLIRTDKHQAGRYVDVGRVLGLTGTRRNWTVVTSVLDLATGPD